MSEFSVAIVTGGAQGLGAAICVELLNHGYKVCVADIQEPKGKHFVSEQQAKYGSENVIYTQCDGQKTAIMFMTLKAFQKVDLLINIAGINFVEPLTLLQVNLLGPVIGCQTALNYMGKSRGGKGGVVINIPSAAGFLPVPVMPVYSASKHGFVGLTRSYGAPSYLEKEGIVFAALCPSLIDTEMLRLSKENNVLLDIPKRWTAMSPEFASKAVTKILEDKINGSTLLVTPEGYQYIGYQEEFKDKLLLE